MSCQPLTRVCSGRVVTAGIGIAVVALLALAVTVFPSFAASRAAVQVSGNAFLDGPGDDDGISVVFQAVPGSTGETDSTQTGISGAFAWTIDIGIYTVRYTKPGYLPYETPTPMLIAADTVFPDVTLYAGEIIPVEGPVSGTFFSHNLYRVTGELEIPVGETLLIQPAVRIEFMGNFGLTVNGTLLAQGTAGDSILFTSGQQGPLPGDWKGIYIPSRSGGGYGDALLSHVAVEYAVTAVDNRGHCRIQNSDLRLVTQITLAQSQNYAESHAELESSRFAGTSSTSSGVTEANGCVFYVLHSQYQRSLDLQQCSFPNSQEYQGNGRLYISNCSDADVRECSFVCSSTSHMGIQLVSSSTDVVSCRFKGFAAAIYLSNGNTQTKILQNTFFSSYMAIQVASAVTDLTLQGNIIRSSTYGITNTSHPIPYIGFNCLYNVNTPFYGSYLPTGIGQVVEVNANNDPCDPYYNIFLDPLMVDPNNGDYQLTSASPCIDAADNPGQPTLPLDPDGTIADMGAFYYSQGAAAPPSIAIAADPLGGPAPLGVSFTCTNTGGPITGYLWDFGDGGTSVGAAPHHVFTQQGTYPVTLTATGPGGTDTDGLTVIVTPSNAPPQCTFTATPLSGYIPLQVCFTPVVVGEVTDYLWDFGDGAQSSDVNPCHLYTAAGLYSVSLTVTGPNGQGTKLKENYIQAHLPSTLDNALYFPWTEPFLAVAGTTIEVAVHARNGVDLQAYSLRFAFDPATFTFVDATIEGTRGEGAAMNPVIGHTDHSVGAAVVYSYACPPSIPPGDGAVLTVRLQVKPDAPTGLTTLTLADGSPSLNRFTGCGQESITPALSTAQIEITPLPLFVRGDVDADGLINIVDPVYNLAYQFTAGPQPRCLDAADTDDNGEVNITDATVLLAHLFAGGNPPPAPFDQCGFDPTDDLLSCNCFPPCGLDCGSPRETVFHVEDVTRAADLILGEPRPGNPGEVLVDVRIENDEPLLGLEFQVDFSGAGWSFAEIRAGNVTFDYLSGHAHGGTIRAGGIADFSLAQPLAPGRHRLGSLVFYIGSAPSLDNLQLHDVLFVLQEATTGGLPEVEPESIEHTGQSVLRLVSLVNPYRAGAAMTLEIGGAAGGVAASVYDLQGREVRTLYRGPAAAGRHELHWDGRMENGAPAASGVYYLRATSGSATAGAKFLYIH